MLVDGSLSLYFYQLTKNLYAFKNLKVSCCILANLNFLVLATENKVFILRAVFLEKV